MGTVLERVSTITEKGQTTVPKPVRDALGVGAGDQIAYRIDEHGVTLHRVPAPTEEDPVLGAFLAFLAQDMTTRPHTLRALSPALAESIAALVDGVDVDLDEEIDGDVGL